MKKEKIVNIIFTLLSKFGRRTDNVVIFESFGGQYNDNSKYISEMLHRISPETSIIWAIAKDITERPPEYVKLVEYKSTDYYKFIKHAKVVVDGYIGASSLGFYNSFGGIIQWLACNKNQLCISTWHGTPLKKIGKDVIKEKTSGYATSTSILICGCEYAKHCLESAYYLYGKTRMYGTPRNDILFRNNDVDYLKQKLKLPLTKIVMYAPTFRDNLEWSGLNQVKMMDIDKLNKALSIKFGGEFSFVFRTHRSVILRMKGETIEYTDKIYDGNIGSDMAEYLVCVNVLITDYSGSLFDIALTKKPCFLFAPDREHYEQKERGFYMKYEDLPFPISYTFQQLVDSIHDYSVDIQEQKRNSFLNSIGNIEDGNASERVAKEILTYLQTD